MFISLKQKVNYETGAYTWLWNVVAMVTRFATVYGATCDGSVTTELTATTEVSTLTSPRYPHDYESNELCRYVINTEKDYEVVHFVIREMDIELTATCGTDYLEAKDGGQTWSRTIKRWCGQSPVSPAEVISSGTSMLIIFRTDGSNFGSGFQADYYSVPKTLVEYQVPQYGVASFILVIFFGIIVVSIIFTIIVITLMRIRNGRLKTRGKGIETPPPQNGTAVKVATSIKHVDEHDSQQNGTVHCFNNKHTQMTTHRSDSRTKLCSITSETGPL